MRQSLLRLSIWRRESSCTLLLSQSSILWHQWILRITAGVLGLSTAIDVALMSADSYRAFAESGSYCVRLANLSDRERRIVQLAADGLPNKRIASILGLSVKTVEKQRRQAYRRLSVTSTAEMTRAVTLGNLHPLLASTVATTS